MRRLLRRKYCGCSQSIGGKAVLKKFSSEMDCGCRVDYVESIRVCDECGELNHIREAWTGMFNSPHPDRREWSRTEMVERENKMGQTVRKRQTIYHEDYNRVYSWCEPEHVENMGRWDRCKNDEPCWVEFCPVPESVENMKIAERIKR